MTSKNISARRNDPVTLICEVFGDNPIQVQWTHNMKRIDLNTYRYINKLLCDINVLYIIYE